MFVQKIKTNNESKYILLGKEYEIIEPVMKYIKYLDIIHKTPNYNVHIELDTIS